MKSLLHMLVAAVITFTAFFAQAQQAPSYGADVLAEQAKKIGTAALAEARKNNWKMAVAVVDTHGSLIYFERMDDTQYASSKIAIEKARTSATFRRPTNALEDALNGGRPSVITLGAMAIDGGLPIVVNGKIIGAVGVSGAAASEDAQCARAGLEAIK